MEKATESRQSIVHVAVLCVILFLAPMVAGKLSPIPSLAIQILVFLAAMLWLIQAAREDSLRIPDRWISYPLAVFFLLLIISAIGSASLHATIRELANIASYLLVFLMVISLRANRPAVYGVLASLMASAFLVGILGIKEYMLAPNSGWRVFSTFFNPDFLAGFMALILPIALAWYLSRAPLGFSIGLGLTVILAFSGVLMSGSRFGSLAAVGGIAVFLILALISRSLKKAHLVKAALLLPVLALIFLTLGRPLAGRISATQAQSHSGGFRIYTWKGTARMAAANPINGTGLGTFEIAYPRYALVGFTKLAHNTYLQLAAEAGPLTPVVLIIILGSSTLPLTIRLTRRQLAADQDWTPLMASGLLGGVAASMARNVVDSDWYVTAIGISFWAVLGAVVALTGGGRIVPVTRRTLNLSVTFVALASLTLIIMLAAELSVAWGNALWAQQPDKAISRYQLAARLDPLNAGFRQRLGSAYIALARETGNPAYADQAERELKQAIRLEPASAKNYYQLGRVFEFYPKSREAIEAFAGALERNPNAPEVMLALADRYEKSDQADMAWMVWKRMVALEHTPFEDVRAVPEMVEPEFIFAHIALARDFERQGDRAAAKEEYEIALDRVERYQECVEAMREVLEANNRRDMEMERRVQEARWEIMRKLFVLMAPTRLSLEVER